ncbi:MAG: type I CRISPR-associated protein Cas7 [Nanoarchaeota archaeon]
MTGKLNRKAIIYLLGFEWSNPNGDPAFDNEPRIIEDKLYTTDVFLKRRIRDYIDKKYGEKDEREFFDGNKNGRKDIIFVKEVTKDDGKSKMTPEQRAEQFEIKSKKDEDKAKELFWDLRVFGAMIPLKSSNESITFIGPVQFTFGTSLNKVISEPVQITNVMAHSEDKSKGGSIGQKHIVPVAIVEYFGFLNDYAAEDTTMNNNDYEKLLEALKNLRLAPSANTATKNPVPLLIVEIDLKDDHYVYLKGNLRLSKEPKTSLLEAKVNLQPLIEKLNRIEDLIHDYKIYIKKEFKELFEGLDNINSQKINYF